eukprot:340588-Prymnesium_polylepis.1
MSREVVTRASARRSNEQEGGYMRDQPTAALTAGASPSKALMERIENDSLSTGAARAPAISRCRASRAGARTERNETHMGAVAGGGEASGLAAGTQPKGASRAFA